MKKTIIIISSIILLFGMGIYAKNINEKRKLEKIINKINLNDLNGNFIIMKNYDEKEYSINQEILEKELTIYLDSIDEKIDFELSVDENIVVIKYQINGKAINKK